MKFTTFLDPEGKLCAGWVSGDGVVDMNLVSEGSLPGSIRELIEKFEEYEQIIQRYKNESPTYLKKDITRIAPLPNPSSFRDFVAFETHVKNATARSGDPMAQEWYEMPIFYFSNHHVMKGPDEQIPRPQQCVKLDYELEMACVIGKKGENIKADEAEDYIFGYTILNDWSARDFQAKEMKVHLGPAKGKDFATSIGPYLVTKEELVAYRQGDKFNLEMTATVNGKVLSRGNFKDIYYSFGQMIERASEGVTLFPGDIIGSGTVGFGCILELGTDIHRWLEPGDEVELEIRGLGQLRNKVV
ncbi:fumarylacetoacetate hydrolase family protein [Sporosarcina sp. ACRSM]|uniref:fumarylacetoacetate hydrolase family protein n=1 Tax=Sporosarcina sp. ACRSM TaxID=2918216 RepID=UPI001EF5F024|nr:fumarylacetoacetate hydrolase family protein [Sporosarcina sp. ACRSM]MCG7337219.1 fumarylacetoacetate hydrolase family protein [Sporosarcina sp. ACRSM]